MEKIPLPAKGIHQNSSRVPGIADTDRLASQPSVFGLALRKEKCQKGEGEKKTTQTTNKKSNAETVRAVRTRLCCSWDFSAKPAQSLIQFQLISLAKQEERRKFPPPQWHAFNVHSLSRTAVCCFQHLDLILGWVWQGETGKPPTGNYGSCLSFSFFSFFTANLIHSLGGVSWLLGEMTKWPLSVVHVVGPVIQKGLGRGAITDQGFGVMWTVLSDSSGYTWPSYGGPWVVVRGKHNIVI